MKNSGEIVIPVFSIFSALAITIGIIVMASYWAGLVHQHSWDAMFVDIAVVGVEIAWLIVPRLREYPLLFVGVIGGWLLFAGFWLSARLPGGHAE
ncbi:MAG: hypothetical protein OWQ57_02000 [Sulfobacillus sp.]|nr:hypothetical protein [Sulfobacillus sp.]